MLYQKFVSCRWVLAEQFGETQRQTGQENRCGHKFSHRIYLRQDLLWSVYIICISSTPHHVYMVPLNVRVFWCKNIINIIRMALIDTEHFSNRKTLSHLVLQHHTNHSLFVNSEFSFSTTKMSQ